MAALPSPVPLSVWHPEVLAWLDSHPRPRWAVACSGGADSVALLHAVAALARSRSVVVVVLHFNHRLRGTASDSDARWVEQLARELGVTCVAGQWTDAPPGGASEVAAREARLAFFRRELAEREIDVLFTGHQADDVAETMLLRLARGAGSAGLSAPRPVQVQADGTTFLRPLLMLRRTALRQQLEAAQCAWREDASNLGTKPPRNALRHHVLPAWMKASDRDPVAGTLRSRALLDEDDAALQSWLDQILGSRETLPAAGFSLAGLEGLPKALWRRALHRWPPARGLSAAGFDQLLARAMLGRGTVSLSEGTAEISGGHIDWRPAPPDHPNIAPQHLAPGAELAWLEGQTVSLQVLQVGGQQNEAIRAGEVDPRFEAWVQPPMDGLWVRVWQAGDRYQPLGLSGSAKVQDLFVNRKVPVEMRPRIPLLCAKNGEIVWIPGFPPADAWRVNADNPVLGRLTYRAGTSTVYP